MRSDSNAGHAVDAQPREISGLSLEFGSGNNARGLRTAMRAGLPVRRSIPASASRARARTRALRALGPHRHARPGRDRKGFGAARSRNARPDDPTHGCARVCELDVRRAIRADMVLRLVCFKTHWDRAGSRFCHGAQTDPLTPGRTDAARCARARPRPSHETGVRGADGASARIQPRIAARSRSLGVLHRTISGEVHRLPRRFASLRSLHA